MSELITHEGTVNVEQKEAPKQELILFDIIYLPTMRFVAVGLTQEEVKRDYANPHFFLACPS